MNKTEQLIYQIRNFYSNHDNKFHTRDREGALFDEITQLDFIEDGNFLKKSIKLDFRNKLIEFCQNGNNKNFSLIDFLHKHPNVDLDKVYLIHEPFGSQMHTDFLFISIKGFLGWEDKKSSTKNGIVWNTGSMGKRKLISYYHTVKCESRLFTSLDYEFENGKTMDELQELLKGYNEAEKEFSSKWIPLFKQFGKKYSISSRRDFKDNNKPSELEDYQFRNVKMLINELLGV